jgi:hypothetical protein
MPQHELWEALQRVQHEIMHLRAVLLAIGIKLDQPPAYLPSASDLRQLKAIVFAALPQLEDEAFAAGFNSAFRWLCTMGRADATNEKRPISFWLATCKDWMLQQGLFGDVREGHLLAAAAAHGDVPFVLPDKARGIVALLGLKIGDGKPYRGAWRTVLTHGCPPMPVAMS